VPDEVDEAGRKVGRQSHDLGIGLVDREAGHERRANTRRDEALDRAVVVRAEDEPRTQAVLLQVEIG
jgi:hypothetical protein